MGKMTSDQIEKALQELEQSWEVVQEERLQKVFVFEDFKEALQFVNSVGVLAEEVGHHPDINLHDYKKVLISLSTHDAGGLTAKDFDVAGSIEGVD